jgi:hypothetical protein
MSLHFTEQLLITESKLQKLSRRPGPAKRKLCPEGRQDTERERDESIPRTEKASGQGT